jgi:hypothetical protein
MSAYAGKADLPVAHPDFRVWTQPGHPSRADRGPQWEQLHFCANIKPTGYQEGRATEGLLMSKFKCLVAVVGWLVAAQPSFADDREKVIGIWKLVSQEIEIQATGQKEPVMGRSPTGYAIFTAEGRVMFVLTGEGRKPPQTVQDRADLLNSMAAYTGMYRLEGDKWITKVDVAWNPEWVGTEQTRFFILDGDRIHVTSTWRIMPNWADKGMQRSLLVFEKAK